MPATINDLPSHQCLVYSMSSDAKRWEFLLSTGSGQAKSVSVAGPLVADNSMMLIEAVKEGLGIVMVPRDYVAAELGAGTLQHLKLGAEPVPRSIYAMYSDRRYLPRRARDLIQFLRMSL